MVISNIFKDKGYREVDEMFAKENLWMVGLVCVIAILAAPATTTLSNGDQPDFNVSRTCDLLKHFSSYEEFKEYVGDNPSSFYYYPWGRGITPQFDDVALTTGFAGGESTPDYTGTNTQIAGIDEADFVKTDGNYIYVVSENELIILKAYPPEDMEIVSRTKLDGKPLMLLLKDDRLILFEEQIVPLGDPVCSAYSYYQCTWYDFDRFTLLKLYDISDRTSPELINEVKVTGEYFDSRIVDDHAYMFVKFSIKNRSGLLTLPTIENDGIALHLGYQEIGYFEKSQFRSQITMVISLNIQEDDDPEHFAFVYGFHSARYVSQNAIYFAGYEYAPGGGNTTIHKADINDGEINYFCSVEVPGGILNQFSMDEHEGNFRIATQLGAKGSNVYVLDVNFNLIGSLEGIEPGESMRAARFVDERLYLVTFRVIDPFFVVDLKNPYQPTILGELEIPGFSTYLHPYDDDHVIGVGMENWNIKIALFKVTDPQNPQEVSKYVIDGSSSWSNSLALGDHKAFTFHKASGLLVIPITYWKTNNTIFRGVSVFKLSLDTGIEYKGEISHYDDCECQYVYDYYIKPYNSRMIERSFYIEGYVYTVSAGMVMASGMTDLQEVSRIDLAEDPDSSGANESTICSLVPGVYSPPATQIAPVINPNLNAETISEGEGSLYIPTGDSDFTVLLFVFQFLAFGLIIYYRAGHKKK